MLDECKGERLEEVLAVFSNAVLKKVLQDADGPEHAALAKQLALENFSYHGERSVLSALILAHKASLGEHLKGKKETKARYHDFSDLLNLNERRITRRHEQLKQAIEENASHEQMSQVDVGDVQNQVQKNWSGNQEWLESILFSDSRAQGEGILSTKFDTVWKHVEDGRIGDIEGKSRVGLLEQLDARVKSQENRLARWQDFGKTLFQPGKGSPAKKLEVISAQGGKIDLGFNLHQALQISSKQSEEPVQSTAVSLDEYNRLIENMKSELKEVGKPQATTQRPPRRSLVPNREIELEPDRELSPARGLSPPQPESTTVEEEGWSSASETDDLSPASTSFAAKSTPQTPPSGSRTLRRGRQRLPDRSSARQRSSFEVATTDDETPIAVTRLLTQRKNISPPPLAPRVPTPEPIEPPILEAKDSESDLADAILNSVSLASPSPKKQRHTLSLAERTRLSMARNSHAQVSDLHDEFEVAQLPLLTIRKRPSLAPKTPSSESEPSKHEALVERTRRSMAGFEAITKKVQLERRRSIKEQEQKKAARKSSYFPKVVEESITPDISAIEMMQGDPDYESVFKSRPKIKTSPAVSPTRSWDADGE